MWSQVSSEPLWAQSPQGRQEDPGCCPGWAVLTLPIADAEGRQQPGTTAGCSMARHTYSQLCHPGHGLGFHQDRGQMWEPGLGTEWGTGLAPCPQQAAQAFLAMASRRPGP